MSLSISTQESQLQQAGTRRSDCCVKYCFCTLLYMPREEFGNCSLEVNVCTSVAQKSSQRGLDCAVRPHPRRSQLAQLAVYPTLVKCCFARRTSIRLEPAFDVLWDIDAPDSRLCCRSPVCVWHERAVRWCAPCSTSSWASRFRSPFFSFSLLCVHLSAASIFAMLRMILERVRCAGPCVRSTGFGLDSSSSSFRIHGACFMMCFASLLSSILPSKSTVTNMYCRLILALSASSLSGSCSSGLPIASACSCTAFLVQSHELRKAASAMMLEGARKLHPPSGPGAETILCSSSLRFVPTSVSVVSLRVLVRISCAFRSVSLGVSLASKFSALAALLDSMAHPAAMDGPSTSATHSSLIASHSFFAASALLIASLAGSASSPSCSSTSLVIAQR